jgi:hypothetical protein
LSATSRSESVRRACGRALRRSFPYEVALRGNTHT